MATNYPSSLDTTTQLPAAGDVGAQLDDFPHDDLHGNVNDAVRAIEAELGANPSGSYATVKARLDELTAEYTAITFDNSWSSPSASYDPLQYRKVGNVVHLYGTVSVGGGSDNEIGTLPVGCRPAKIVGQYLEHRRSDEVDIKLSIASTGVISISEFSGWGVGDSSEVHVNVSFEVA